MASPRLLFTDTALGLSRRLSRRADATMAVPPSGAVTLEGLRSVLCSLLDDAAPATQEPSMRNGSALFLDTPPPREPRGEILPQAGGWRVMVELPGTAPEAVALAMHEGMLLIHASGAYRYEARLPLPPAADPDSFRWYCAHGLLEGCLARRGLEDDR